MGNPKGKPLSSIGGARSGRRAQLSKQAEIAAKKFASNKNLPIPVAQKSQGKQKVLKVPTELCMYVLDTNVLMHDPTCLVRFQEHHVYIPMQVIQELDNHKKGNDEINKNVRDVARMLEDILSKKTNIYDGISLKDISHGIASGSLFLQAESVSGEDLAWKADDKILAVVNYLTIKHKDKYKVVLVSKDTIMRIKARQKGLEVQDYRNDIIIEDTDLLYQGAQALPDDFWEKQPKSPEVKKENKSAIYEASGPFIQSLHPNEFVYSESGLKFEARVTKKETRNVTLSTITDYTHHKNAVWGITARNREQNFSLNLLLDPEVDVVSLLGQAGTGKTLLALAAGLVQVMETKLYKEIIITRVTVPMGVDIGFLPGTEEEKMTPWMGALEDNLEVLAKPVKPEEGEKAYGGDWGRAATMDLVRNHIKVKSLNFMRGRTFLNKFLIVDEAQNLTPKLMKALMTRAGPGTKVVCLGNLAQIDTPYLTEGSSGLTHLVDSFKGWRHNGHITLIRGERSRLADHANQVL